MEHKYRGYAGVGVIVGRVVGILVISIFTGVGAFIPIQAAVVKGPSLALNVSFLGIWFILLGWMIGLGLINQNPSVWLTPDYLVITAFPFGKVKIPWPDVEKVTVRHMPFELVVIQARRITFFHRLYGWLYSWSCAPSFIIRPEIENYAELISEIRRRAGRVAG